MALSSKQDVHNGNVNVGSSPTWGTKCGWYNILIYENRKIRVLIIYI